MHIDVLMDADAPIAAGLGAVRDRFRRVTGEPEAR
jgi:hypothetical protein